MAIYYLKQYGQSLPGLSARKLIAQQLVESDDDQAAKAAAKVFLKELGSNEFLNLENEAGSVVAAWCVYA